MTMNPSRRHWGLALAWALVLLGAVGPVWAETLSLAGTWRFGLDPGDAGERDRWYVRELPDRLRLPGSLQLQGFGDLPSLQTRWMGDIVERSFFNSPRYAPYRDPRNFKVPFWLTPTRYYAGAAWYQRDVEIPESWRGRRVVLRLERPHWETRVWLGERMVGMANSLAGPHEHDLTDVASPGRHRLTVRVDNRYILPVGVNSHSVSDHTQGNWNGIVGALELVSTPRVWIERVRVDGDPVHRAVTVVVQGGNRTGADQQAVASLRLIDAEGRTVVTAEQDVVFRPAGGGAGDALADGIPVRLELGERWAAWDEFHPRLFDLHVELRLSNGERDAWRQRLGFRQVGVSGSQITVNGRPVFLRGTLECAIFPRTGYPPTDRTEWKRIMAVARGHGLNHLRFHSWTPPRAAFEAADEMGFYLYVECPTWANQGATVGDGGPLDAWVYAEGDRMLALYGNHPSFVMMSYGNEPAGRRHAEWLGGLVNHWRRNDPRRLYTSGAGWPMIPESDFHVTPQARAHPVHAQQGETSGDYSAWHAKQNKPIVSHEIGQYCVFPNLDEIRKYTGWLKAGNFEIVRDFLSTAGLRSQARDFLRASGRLQVAFYKDEIEACLRTPGWAGFELLDLHDFPGQGSALVGVLDPFWEGKGYLTPAEFRRFCADTVPLARLAKRVWTTAETLEAQVDLAHFGPADLGHLTAGWTLWQETNGRERERAHGTLEARAVATGRWQHLGLIRVPLSGVSAPSALRLEVRVAVSGRSEPVAENDWNLWVYPAAAGSEPASDEVRVSRVFTVEEERALEAGKSVVLLADPARVAGNTVGRFDPVFWNRLWFPGQPQHTLGLLVQTGHGALSGFPTRDHSDWQWQDLHNRSKPMVLSGLPTELRPVVQVIDDWNTCRKLGLLFEARAGKGRLLVCSIDLSDGLEQRPAARAFRASLLRYAAGSGFRPRTRVTYDQVRALFREPGANARLGVRIVSADSQQEGFEAARALDGDPSTLWHTAWGAGAKAWPHELVVAFARPGTLHGVRLVPRQDGNRNGWFREVSVESSPDGAQWSGVSETVCEPGGQPAEIRFGSPITPRFLKFRFRSGFDEQPFVSLAELEFLMDPRENTLR